MAAEPRRRDRTAIEDYLKTIWGLTEWEHGQVVSNAAVAERLRVSTSSVSEMVRKLSRQGLVRHEPWGGIELTDEGRREATSVVRRHRLLETFLSRQLGYAWDEVHDEAEVLEHAASELMIARIDRLLGHPYRDPHGDPIPTPEGTVHRPEARPLAALEPGERGFVARILDDSPELLRWLGENQLGLDAAVVVREQEPFGGPLVVEAGGEAGRSGVLVSLGLQVVTSLWLADRRPTAPDVQPPRLAESRPGCPYPDCRHDGES